MTTNQWIGVIATIVVCGGGLIFVKKEVPLIFDEYKWWVLVNFILFMALYICAWPRLFP